MKLPLRSSPLFQSLLVAAALSCALFLPQTAKAGAVYRCSGSNGQIAFTNNPGTYKQCSKVSEYKDPAPSRPAASAGKHVEYRSAVPASGNDAVNIASVATEPTALAAPASTEIATDIHRGAVYKLTRANGITEYTNVRPSRGAYQLLFTYISTCFACNVHSTVNWNSTALNRVAYNKEVAAAAIEFGVDPALLRAVIHAESAFNPNAISTAGAQGLMQLMPGTASDLGVNNPFDVTQNIRGGAQYLAGLLKQFKGDERMATAAYNAGAQNVTKYNGVPPFDETRVYVDRVATLHQRYRAAE